VTRRAIATILASGATAAAAGRARRAYARRDAVVSDLRDDTAIDGSGAVRSVQAATLSMPAGEVTALWNQPQLERLARTYWRFLGRITLGALRVAQTETTRSVVLVAAPLRLLRFGAPEYRMDAASATVRWRIEDGMLVSAAGRGHGHLELEVRRLGPGAEGPDREALRVRVEVASFHPSLAGISRRFYERTQSATHVIVTNAFLRSLARMALAGPRAGPAGYP